MYDIRDLKIGDIMVCGTAPHRQLFYIHNIDLDRERIESSGFKELYCSYFFDECYMWGFDRLATQGEVELFYELIDRHGFKFNINTGVSR
jgi:hypothetical protein